MQFLYPAFLFALFSLIVPLLVHLFNFRRYKKVLFSHVQFLKEVQERQASRRNIKERLILAARLLALTFLVFAFARPFIAAKDAVGPDKQQVISIFIDNSYSMQALSKEGSLLDEAKQKAKQIAAAYAINDRFQLLTQDFEGRHQRLLNRDEFIDAVDAVKISPQSRNITGIIARQQCLIKMQPNANGHDYILSDFQKNLAAGAAISNVPVTLVQFKANELPNVAVDSVWLLNATHRPGETEKLVVRLHNYASKTAEKVPLKLLINGSQKSLGSFSVKAGSRQTDTLTFSGLAAGWQRGEVILQDNPVTFDNSFYFTFNVSSKLPVLLIGGETTNKYLNAVFGADAFFSVKNVQDGNIDYASLNSYPLVVIADVNTVTAGLAQQLTTFIKRGGSLAVFPSANAEIISYAAFLKPLGAATLDKLITEPTRVSVINLQSAVFKNIFESFPQNPDLPVVKKYYGLTAAGRSVDDLMKLQAGQPFWQSYNFGRGKVYLCAVALNEDFSNLPVHALFVPVMFKIALLSGHDQPLFHTIGSAQVIETLPLLSTEKQLVKLVKGTETIIPEVRQQEGGTMLFLPGQLTHTGLYDLKKQDSTAAVLAFNDNRSESDLSYLSNSDLDKIFPRKAGFKDAGKFNVNNINSAGDSGIQLWKLCIILTLIFLAAETLLIRFYKTDKQYVRRPDDL